MKKQNKYIWYCIDCNNLLFKTDSPFLGNVEIKCNSCGQLNTTSMLEARNNQNFKLYFAKK